MDNRLFEAIFTLTGCIIGAGVLGIPFVVVRSGFWTGLLVIVLLGVVSLFVHLLMAEVCLRTKGVHQLAGYAEKYLGKPGKFFMFLSLIIGVYGAMIAYTLGVGASLSIIFGGPSVLWMIVFYLIMSVLLFGGLKILARSEFAMEFIKLSVFIVVIAILFLSSKFSVHNFVGFSWNRVLLPFGVILFAYIGTAAIPEVHEVLRNIKSSVKSAVIFGSLIPMLVYVLFAFAVIGVSGFYTTEVASIGLASLIGGIGFVLLHLFAILAMATSFLALGYALKDSYRLDFKLPAWESWLLTLSIPVVFLLIGVSSFVRVLELAGVFAGGIAGLTIVWMHARSIRMFDRKPEFKVRMRQLIYSVLIIEFVIGMFWELLVL